MIENFKVDITALEKRIFDDKISNAKMHGEGVAKSIQEVLEQLIEYKKGATFWRTAYFESREELVHTKQNYELHIKELRYALTEIRTMVNNTGLSAKIIDDILAKQPDTNALEKALIESEIKVLSHLELADDILLELQTIISDNKAKISELNKLIEYKPSGTSDTALSTSCKT